MDIEILSAEDVAEIMKISLKKARAMFRQKDFPRVPGTRLHRVEKQAFLEYIRGGY